MQLRQRMQKVYSGVYSLAVLARILGVFFGLVIVVIAPSVAVGVIGGVVIGSLPPAGLVGAGLTILVYVVVIAAEVAALYYWGGFLFDRYVEVR